MEQPADVTRSVLQGEGEEGKEKPSSPLQQPLSCFPKPGPGAAGRAASGLVLASGVHIFLCRTLRKAISHTSSFPRGGRTHSGGHPSFRAPKPPEQAPLSAYNLPSRGAIVCHAVGTAVGFPRTLPTSLQITSNSREA